jgi:hypothetical protein
MKACVDLVKEEIARFDQLSEVTLGKVITLEKNLLIETLQGRIKT